MLSGHRAIVTGGMRGIGLAIARELSRQGASVVIGSRQGDDADAGACIEADLPGPGRVLALDVSESSSIMQFMDSARDFHGPADILINNAGISVHHGVIDHDEAAWNRVIDVNLSGPFRMMRAALPEMKSGGWGRIINIASTAARVAESTHAAYCASKAGLVGLTRAVAREVAPDGISCLCVSPTWVETDMLTQSAQTMAGRSGRSVAQVLQEISQANPQGRLVQPEEVAALVAFCCSDAAPALTMEDIQINAGALW